MKVRRLMALFLTLVLLVTLIPLDISVAAGDGEFSVTNLSVMVKPTGESAYRELADNMTGLYNGDSLAIVINWAVANSNTGGADATFNYSLDPIVGIALNNTNGIVTNDDNGSVTDVGTWKIENQRLSITLNGTFLAASNVTGTTSLNGVISVSNDDDSYTKNTTIKVGSKSYNVTINTGKNPSSVDLSKSKGAVTIGSDGTAYVTYTVTAQAKNGAATDVKLEDSWGTGLALDGSVSFSSTGTATTSVSNTSSGFSTGAFNLASNETVTLTYTLKMTSEKVDEVLLANNSSTLDDNKIDISYKNDKSESKTDNKSTYDIGLTQPSISKSGTYQKNGTDDNDTDDTVKWTVTISGGSSILKNWTFTDTFKTDNLKEPTSAISYTLNPGGTTGTFSSLSDVSTTLASTISGGTVGSITLEYETPIDASKNTTSVVAPQYVNYVGIKPSTATTDYKNTTATVNGIVPGNSTLITKTGGTVNTTDKTVEWTTTLTIPAGVEFTDYQYSDSIANGHKLVKDSISVTGATQSEYSINGNSANNGWFNISFTSTVADNSASATDKQIVITYKTVYDESVEQLKNTGTINFKENNIQSNKSDEDTVTVTLPKTYDFLDKGYDQNYTQGGNYAWYIKVNISKKLSTVADTEVLVLTDVLPENMEFVSGSERLSGNGWSFTYQGSTNIAQNTGFTTSYDTATRKVTFNVTVGWLKSHVVQYNTNVIFGYLTKISDMSVFLSGGSKNYTNTVSGVLDSIPVKQKTSTWYNVTPGKILDKQATYDATTAPYIKYVVTVNEKGYDLVNGDVLTLTDTLGDGMSFIPPGGMSFKKYVSGNWTSMETSEYSWDYNATEKKITFTVPDSTPVKIEYQTRLSAEIGSNFSVKNDIAIYGVSATSGSTSKNLSGIAVNNSSSAQHTTGSVTVYKYYGTDGLKGASFSLYRLEDNGSGGYNEIASGTLQTGDLGTSTLNNIQYDNIYKLVETAAPTGYKLDATPYYFILQGVDKKTLPTQFASNGTEYTGGTLAYVQVENEPKTADVITISKKAISGKSELAGASLSLYSGTATTGTAVATWTSGSAGNETGKDFTIVTGTPANGELVAGTYTLVETGAPNGYKYTENITFTIAANGEITSTATNGDISTDKKTLTMRDGVLDDIYISKMAIAGSAELAGAHIKLTEKVGGALVEEWNSATTAHQIAGSKLKADTEYILEETAAPNGYKTTSNITFKVDKNGVVTLSANNTNAAASVGQINGSATNNQVIMRDEVKPADVITISKKAISGKSELAGASLSLYSGTATTGTAVATWTSGSVGNETGKDFTIVTGTPANGELVAGTYTLVENGAPNGYKYTENITFTIAANGEITSTATNGDISTDKKTLTMRDGVLDDIYISKMAIAGSAELAGAHIKLTEKVGGALVEEWNSATTAHQIAGSKLKADTEYVLEETTAPNGYKTTSNITFKVDKNGVVTLSANNTNADASVGQINGSATNNQVIMRDEVDNSITTTTQATTQTTTTEKVTETTTVAETTTEKVTTEKITTEKATTKKTTTEKKTTETEKKTDKSSKTGDVAPIMMIAVIFILSSLTFIIIRKKEQDELK